MSYLPQNPTTTHPGLLAHHAAAQHRLVSDPVQLPAGAAVPALQFHGGPTVKAPKLVALYAGPFWGDRAKNDQFLQELASYGYLSGLAGQGSGNGAFLGSFDLPAPASGALTDADCQAMVRAALGKGGVPAADLSTIYLLILPDGVKVSFTAGGDSSCAQFCAYHSGAPDPFLYTVQPANTCSGCNQGVPQDGLQMTEAHEVAETCSDPTGQGWFNDQSGEENADEVAWIQQAFGPWVVQGYAAQDASGQWVDTVGAYIAPVPQPQPHFKPSGDAADAWAQLEQGGALAKAELTLLLGSDPDGRAAPAWRYLLQGGSVQALLDSGWGNWFHGRGTA